MRPVELSSYSLCPNLGDRSCQFGEEPRISLDTNNAIAPRVDIYACSKCGHGVTRPAMPDVKPLYEGRESQDYLSRDTGWVETLKSVYNLRLAKRIVKFAPKAKKRRTLEPAMASSQAR